MIFVPLTLGLLIFGFLVGACDAAYNVNDNQVGFVRHAFHCPLMMD